MCKPTVSEKRVLAAETIFHSAASSRHGTPSVINFEVPVNICEINILSPSMFLSTEHGGFITGGTDPSEFLISFHCNDVDEDSASANVELGELNYVERLSTIFRCQNEIWTNRLIMFGKYSALTIVVYGTSKDPKAEYLQREDTQTNIPPIGPTDINGIISFY